MVRKRTPGAVVAAGRPTAVAVIGLGRFGSAVALELVDLGVDVLGVDDSATVVQQFSDQLTHIVQANSTDPLAMEQIGIGEFVCCVIGIGSDIEASLLTAAVLLDAKVPQIWAKAVTEPHAEILTKLGVHHVIRPEHEMGRRVGILLRGGMVDYFEMDDGFAMAEVRPPAELIGAPLDVDAVLARTGVRVVALKRHGDGFVGSLAGAEIRPDDVLVIAGPQEDVVRFANRRL